MNKLLIKINDDKELIYPSIGYILGIKGYCICFDKTYLIDDIKKIINNNPDKKIFVSLNRMILNSELKDYFNTLHKLDKLDIDGIIVSDIAALNLNLKTPLILDQKHLNNSYLSINHYYNNRVLGTILTNDITIDEINEIRKNTKSMLFKEVFCLPHLSTSRRKLVTNYLEYFNIKSSENKYYICEENSNKFYHIVEDYYGTHIFNNKALNLLDKFDKINVDYYILDSYLLDKDNYEMVISAFLNNDKTKNNKINNIYNANEGFIDTKTIYKVRNDE